jgi:DNA-binding SARP family transcriptional activator
MQYVRAAGAGEGKLSPVLFEQFPYGLAFCDRDGKMVQLNHHARRILLPDDARAVDEWCCCELICQRLGSILGTGCIAELVIGSSLELPEVRIDLDGERLQTSAWVTASVLDAEHALVLFHLRPARPGDRRRRTRQGWHGDSLGGGNAELQVTTLGRFGVEGPAGPINGDWLEQRPGEVLKYLLCERRRAVANDQIGEALWPGSGPDEGRNRLRFHIHGLRERIEPGRAPHAASRFIASRRGGYLFDTALVWVDADEFEREAKAGLSALDQGSSTSALPHLHKAASLYRGDFMAEDPYAEWALEERERLRDLAALALRGYVELLVDAGELEAAVAPARRLCELEPFDDGAQKLLIELSLRRGRRSEAVRRYDSYRGRVQRCLGVQPEFDLQSLQKHPVKAVDTS